MNLNLWLFCVCYKGFARSWKPILPWAFFQLLRCTQLEIYSDSRRSRCAFCKPRCCYSRSVTQPELCLLSDWLHQYETACHFASFACSDPWLASTLLDDSLTILVRDETKLKDEIVMTRNINLVEILEGLRSSADPQKEKRLTAEACIEALQHPILVKPVSLSTTTRPIKHPSPRACFVISLLHSWSLSIFFRAGNEEDEQW